VRLAGRLQDANAIATAIANAIAIAIGWVEAGLFYCRAKSKKAI